jgi:REP element-mobilizing transposase RayT
MAAGRRARAARARQGELAFSSWGGRRKGAGRKRRGPRPRVDHRTRPALAPRFPVHVTTRLRAGLPSLRRQEELRVLHEAFFAGMERFGFRLVHFSVQSNHLHMIAEARDRHALALGMQGLSIRVAKALNKLWSRRGAVFDDRYHARILRTPREVKNGLCYVLSNARRHGLALAELDPFSSARWFDGWRGIDGPRPGAYGPIAAARTWLVRVGWRRHGRIDPEAVPGRT